MYRKNGAIPPLTQEKYPKRLLVMDSEAIRGAVINGVETQVFKLAICRYLQLEKDCQVTDNGYETFLERDSLIDFIQSYTRKDKVTYVYAHNLKYDLQLTGLVTGLLERGWKISLFVLEDPPSFIRLKRGRMSLLLVDTFNYWQFSVEKMGLQLGLEKMKMPDPEGDIKDWIAYCTRDVDVLTEYLLTFMRFLIANDLAGLGLTLASQAFRSYRHRFMPREIILHSYPEVTRLEREAYTGGRVEAFYIGRLEGERFYKLDVNSMYPYVMKERLYPYEMVSYSENVTISQLKKLFTRYYLIAEVELNTSSHLYAIKDNFKLIFPVGHFWAVLHASELKEALENNHLISVHRLAVYKQADIFSPYVNYFYRMKVQADKEHNPVDRHMAKILLNSLYGKFGQREVVSKIYDNPDGVSYQRLTGYSERLGQAVEVNYIGSQIEVRYKGGESAYSFPAIAGAVTAYARMYLWEIMQTAGLENVFYVDTDSLIVNRAGYERLQDLLHPDRLGALKLESQGDCLTINGAKDYSFAGEVKVKGVPKTARVLSGNQWQYEQFRGAKTWLAQGMPVNVEVYTRLKERKTPYDKGVVTPSGYVLPLRLNGR